MVALQAPVVVGRATETGALRAALAAAVAGNGTTVLLTGDAGVGKSRLLREVRRWCVDRGMGTLVGRAVESVAPVPFRPVTEALLAACRGGPVTADPDVAPFGSALAALVPGGSPATAAPVPSLLHVAEGVLRVARSLGRGGRGCAVLLEDLHWADAESLAVVEYLADNVAGEPVLVVATARSEPPVPALAALVARRAVTELPVPRLTAEETVAMARGCLGDAAVPAAVLQAVADRADGLPFLVEELLTDMAGSGVLTREDGRWVAGPVDQNRPPSSFAESVRRRLARLPEDAREVLLDAALLGRRVDPERLAEVCAVGPGPVAVAVRLALEENLLERGGSGLRFRHALTRDALQDQLLPAERAVRARRVLTALRSTRRVPDDELTEVVAELAEAAGERDTAARLFHRVGARALACGALTSAEAAERRALALCAGGPVELDVLESLVTTLGAAGRVDDALPVGEALLARLVDGADPTGRRRHRLHLALARAAVAGTEWSLARSHLRRAGELVDRDDDPAAARLDALGALVALGEHRLDEADSLAAAAVARAAQTDDDDLLCEALLARGRCLRVRDPAAAETAFRRATEVARRGALAHREARALTELGSTVMYRRDRVPAERARQLARACGAFETEAVAECALALAHWFDADAEGMARHAEAALRLAARYRLGQFVPAALVVLASAHALRGDRAAVEQVLAGVGPSLDGQPTEVIALHTQVRAVCALALDDLAGASAELAAGAAAALAARPTTVPPMLGLAPLMLAVDGEDPAELIRRFRERHYDSAPQVAALLVAAEAVRVAPRDPDAATAGLGAALGDLDGAPFLVPVVARLVAPRAAVGGWGEPARWLADAVAGFVSLDLPAAAAGCRAELDRLRRPAGARELTAREAEVLALVAEGLPNREIAGRLFLSPRTVEKHVERLLAKTGTANRAQLAVHAFRQR